MKKNLSLYYLQLDRIKISLSININKCCYKKKV